MVNGRELAPLPRVVEGRQLPLDHWHGRRVTVMGLGTHGGAVGAVHFLARRGARVRLTDLRSEAELASSLAEISDVPLERLRLSEHREEDFRNADAVIVNPAVRFDHPLLQAVRERGVPILTEVGLVWQHTAARVVAVTGSVGKSTTVTMIDAVLREAGLRAWLGGNIGGSLLNDIDSIKPEDWLVLELSSFQLAYLSEIGFRPEVAVITNFSANHLDWHGTLDEYRLCKQQILAHQWPSDVAVLNGDDADVTSWYTQSQVVRFGSRDKSATGREYISSLPSPPGRRAGGDGLAAQSNRPLTPIQRNALAAATACRAIGIEDDSITAGLSRFSPLPHRFENLGVHLERSWINDSKATTPAAALAAINSCERPWVLLGGVAKNVELRTFCETIAPCIAGAALLGEAAGELNVHLRHANRQLPRRVCASLSEAVAWAAESSSPGDTILLSPACASLDWFRDYADRGEQFRRAVLEYDQSRPSLRESA